MNHLLCFDHSFWVVFDNFSYFLWSIIIFLSRIVIVFLKHNTLFYCSVCSFICFFLFQLANLILNNDHDFYLYFFNISTFNLVFLPVIVTSTSRKIVNSSICKLHFVFHLSITLKLLLKMFSLWLRNGTFLWFLSLTQLLEIW